MSDKHILSKIYLELRKDFIIFPIKHTERLYRSLCVNFLRSGKRVYGLSRGTER